MVMLNCLAAIISSVGLNTGSGIPSASAGPTEVWLAVLRPGATSCPAGGSGWTLLPPAGTPFERFCAYGFFPSKSFGTPDPYELEHPDLEGLADATVGRVRPQQVAATTSMAPPPQGPTAMSAIMAPYLWDRFRARVGLPSAPAATSPAPNVRLAIVDTMPDGAPNPNSSHAPTLGALAEAMACTSSGQCAVDIHHHLALPRVEGGEVDLVNGGHYGTLWELARGIQEATTGGIADGFERVIINLSLGWDPDGQASLPTLHLGLLTGSSNLPAPIRAVHTALVFARCQGALIIAASGNDDAGLEDRSGPLLPAGWMVHEAPSTAMCTSLYSYGRRGQPQIPAKSPLLYAVGGVNHLSEALENARPLSTPELVAPASSVVGPAGGAVLTGTSVGALVASTASGLVWAIQPQGGADATLTTVKQSAKALPWAASFCDAAICPAVRQISLCAAQQAATGGNGLCPTGATTAEWPLDMFLQSGVTLLSSAPLSAVTMSDPQTVPGCGQVRLPVPSPWPAALPCPLDDLVAARNLDVGPQPLDPMCPDCFAFEHGEVLVGLQLLPEIPGGFLYDVYLKVSDGQDEQTFALPSPMPQGYTKLLSLSPTGWASPIKKAWLQYVVDNNGQPYLLGEPLIVH